MKMVKLLASFSSWTLLKHNLNQTQAKRPLYVGSFLLMKTPILGGISSIANEKNMSIEKRGEQACYGIMGIVKHNHAEGFPLKDLSPSVVLKIRKDRTYEFQNKS